MKKIISMILIFIGISLICYPKLCERYYDEKRREIMSNIQVKNEEDLIPKREVTIDEVKKENKVEQLMLKITKINLWQPILNGASEENLKVSIGLVNKEAKPGEVGNYVLAGHRSHTYGRNFNRLDEVVIGDEIEIHDGLKRYVYIIDRKIIVKPDDVWVMDENETDKELTLITCHPMINPTHRLIIKGKIKT